MRDLKTYDGKLADWIRYNHKMINVLAAMGQIQLARLDDFIG